MNALAPNQKHESPGNRGLRHQAQRYAAANRIRFVGGAELARLLPALGRAPRAGTQPR